MNMRMNFEFLAPGMQHAEEANLCAEVSRMASDFEKGFGTGAEQEIVEDLLVLQNQWRQAAGEREDHVQVAGREQFSSTRSVPVPRSDTSGSGDCGSCYTRWWHDARNGCTHRDDRRVRRYDIAEWPATLCCASN